MCTWSGSPPRRPGTRRWRRKLVKALAAQGAEDIIVICGGVIPQQDYEFLYGAGVKAIFGPGTNIPEAAANILGLIRTARQPEAAE